MPEGDAPLSPVVSVLRELGGEAATGCLAVRRPDGHVSRLYLAEGRLYAADAPGERPTLGTRLVTYGVVSSLDVLQALDRQWAERDRRQLGEVLVHLERAEPEAVAPHVRALLVDTVADALAQEMDAWQFRAGSEARSDVGDPLDPEALLDELTARAEAWGELAEQLGGPFVTVRLVDPPERVDDLDLGEVAVLDRLTPESTLPRIALDTGLTLLEVAQHVRRLTEDGVVTVAQTPAEPTDHEGAESDAAPGTSSPHVQPDPSAEELPDVHLPVTAEAGAPAAEAAPEEPAAETVPEDAAAETVPEDAAAEEPATDEAAVVEPAADEATVGEPPADEPAAEEPAADAPASGEPVAVTDADTPDKAITDETPATDAPEGAESPVAADGVASSHDGAPHEGAPYDGSSPDEGAFRDAADEDPETQAFDTAALLRELASLGSNVPPHDGAPEGEKASGRGHH